MSGPHSYDTLYLTVDTSGLQKGPSSPQTSAMKKDVKPVNVNTQS